MVTVFLRRGVCLDLIGERWAEGAGGVEGMVRSWKGW